MRAIAIASEQYNTVGTVELECAAQGLVLTYVDTVRVMPDGAPIAFEPWQQVTIEWSRLRHATQAGAALSLEFELPTSGLQRCLLVHFSTGPAETHQELQQKRLLFRLWTVGSSVVLASAIALASPRVSPQLGPWLGLFGGLAFAAILMAIGFTAEQFIATGGRHSKLLGEQFINDLIAFVPAVSQEPLKLPVKQFVWPRLDGLLPRTTLAIALTLAGALLAALIMFRWVSSNQNSSPEPPMNLDSNIGPRNLAAEESPKVPEPISESRPKQVAAAPVTDTATPIERPAPSAASVRLTGPCDCQRADSLLWSQPIPRVSLIVLASRKSTRRNHDHIELEFAAINNSDREISELTSMVEFFVQDPPPSSKLVSVSTRAVYFQGPLQPGEAIKWHVDADGTTFRIHPVAENGNPIAGSIEENGSNAASTNAVAKLLKAHNRPVRLHGAMLLAFLRDPRAREAAVELGDSLRDSESGYLRRLMEALAEIRVCRVQVSGTGAHRRVIGCVFNTSNTPRTPVEVMVRALDATVSNSDPVGAPPQVISEKSALLPGSLLAQGGVFAQIDIDFAGMDQTPAAFEVTAQVAAAH